MEPRLLLLACEDEERIIELLRALCEPLGVDVIAARDGATALAYLAAKRPAMMTLDLVLPNLDGFAVLERLRQRREYDDIPILVISALGDVQSVKRAYTLGAVDYVLKPFNVDLLDAKLRTFLRMRKLSDAVKQREAFLEQVVEQVSSGLIVVDGEGTIVKVNHAASTSIARSPESLVGRTVAEALPGAEPMFVVSGDARQRRVTVTTPAGPRALGFTNAAVEVNGRTGAVAVFRELSGAEVSSREREEQSRWAELTASARAFIHEVRNPLTAIGAAAQVIARDDCDRAMRVRLARAIEGEAARVSTLVEQYVAQREPSADASRVEVPALLAEVVDVNLLHSPARARVSIACEGTLPAVRIEPARLKQVVLNLLLNAVKATDRGGLIQLAARTEDGGVALSVVDTGCGIGEADLPFIFDESYSTRGGGLGLPIARRIVEAARGTIRVESTRGRGSTFTVWLPSI
jgi:signal transduction histidine kinase